MLAAALLCFAIGVSDGDTLTVRCPPPDERTKVRIAVIDAPERERPYSRISRQSLMQLCYKQQATISPRDVDRYGRIVADVRCQGQDAAQHQVASGMAWIFDKYAAQHQHLYSYQQQAQAARRELWQDAHAVPPWEWPNSNIRHLKSDEK